MSLRLRLVLLFLVAAFVPFGALGLVVRDTFVHDLEADHRRRFEARTESLRRRLDETLEADARAVRALCAHDPFVDRLVLDLATDRFDPAREQALVTALPSLMQGRRFDTLHLLDARGGPDRGRLLGAGHYPDRVGARAPELLDALARNRDHAWLETVRVRDEEGPRDARALVVGCTVERDGAAVAVLGGRFATDDLLGLQSDDEALRVSLLPPGEDVPVTSGEPPRVVRTFASAEGEHRLVASLDDAPLRADLASLRERTLVVAGVALLVALGFALLVGWMFSRPLREIEEATRRVAKGDLESRVATATTRGDDVGRTLRAFDAMTKELAATRLKLLRAERIAAWREVARRIAHEIKNPLQPIQVEIETMRKLHARKHPSFDEEFDQSTGVILEEVKRLNDMVTEFSKFARMPRPKPAPLDLREVVQHVASLHMDDEVGLKVVLPERPLVVRADRDQLTQVLLNLVQNASDAASARHGTRGGHVEVHLQPTEGGARLWIDDDGPGIGPEDRLRVFEPYFTTKAKGTGLGLAIVHRIVGDHGGTIDVGDGLDGGARFEIVLPEKGPIDEEPSASLSDTALPLTRKTQP
ncbi:MAG: HAMP domain-containing protein [Sandaracinus sp.]|nr:HAMP domain-containing protein [Sandaracinus sp.]MCB9621517.1 HAMP domain-containing protein [Sandaracinus sp.]